MLFPSSNGRHRSGLHPSAPRCASFSASSILAGSWPNRRMKAKSRKMVPNPPEGNFRGRRWPCGSTTLPAIIAEVDLRHAQCAISRGVAWIQLHCLIKIGKRCFKFHVQQKLLAGKVCVHVASGILRRGLFEFLFGALRLKQCAIDQPQQQVSLIVFISLLPTSQNNAGHAPIRSVRNRACPSGSMPELAKGDGQPRPPAQTPPVGNPWNE